MSIVKIVELARWLGHYHLDGTKFAEYEAKSRQLDTLVEEEISRALRARIQVRWLVILALLTGIGGSVLLIWLGRVAG